MFNRRLMIIVASFVATIGALWWYWQTPPGESLNAGQGVISTTRFTQNLNGSWDQFTTLRQAWATESERVAGKNNQNFLMKGRTFTLPSSERFTVAAKRLRVPGEWSSRTMLLTFNGVYGHANVFLNGIGSGQKVGEFEGTGGADGLEIPAKAFRYGEDNILVIELSGGTRQRTMFLGSSWPKSGYVTGEIRLEAVVETSLAQPTVNVSWNDTSAQVTVTTNLIHHGFSPEGPWTVNGVLSDGSSGVAEQTLSVEARKDSDRQPVTLTFSVPDARRWTMQTPFLYQLNLTVTNSKGDVDELALPLGLRSIDLKAGKWFINDQVVVINGEALTPQEEYRLRHAGQIESWLQSKRKDGINIIYFIGQIPDELWLQAADRVGMGLWAELPVELIPSSRLPQPGAFRNVIGQKMLHPSLWAWTVGKGLEADSQTYLQQSAKTVQPALAFALNASPMARKGLSPEQLLAVQGNKIQGVWGQVSVKTRLPSTVNWLKEPMVAGLWAGLMIFLFWMNILSVTWRYKEICTGKPKRKLRR
ncbi:MAG: glycosyl hydrolase, partial [Bacillota bacterium]|nr:glycosyl hydrolase [Bacillota bacterium]